MLDEVTVTATRLESRIGEVPATVSIYSSERIQTLLAQDIKDLIRFEPGVSVRSSPARFTAAGSSAGRDGNSGFNVRGLEGNRVLIQVDGVRTPDAYSFGAQSVGRGDYVDLDILKSVEIVRGPASALYGSDGLAGSVSFITKDPADVLGADRSGSLGASASYASADEQFSQGVLGAARFGALRNNGRLHASRRRRPGNRRHEQLREHRPHDGEPGGQPLELGARQGDLLVQRREPRALDVRPPRSRRRTGMS